MWVIFINSSRNAIDNIFWKGLQKPMLWSFIDPRIALLDYFCVCLAVCKRPVSGNIFPPQSLGKCPKNFDKIVHIWGYRQDGCGQNISELICLNLPISLFFILQLGCFTVTCLLCYDILFLPCVCSIDKAVNIIIKGHILEVIFYIKANLRDLITATGLVILLKLYSSRRFFSLCGLEIWWMTLKNNKAPLK